MRIRFWVLITALSFMTSHTLLAVLDYHLWNYLLPHVIGFTWMGSVVGMAGIIGGLQARPNWESRTESGLVVITVLWGIVMLLFYSLALWLRYGELW